LQLRRRPRAVVRCVGPVGRHGGYVAMLLAASVLAAAAAAEMTARFPASSTPPALTHPVNITPLRP
jgi:hypothetical protein